jgi:transposase
VGGLSNALLEPARRLAFERTGRLPGSGHGHTTLCHLAEGHFPKRMKAAQAAAILARLRPGDLVSVERKSLARELLAEIRRLHRDLAALGARITTTVTASGTSVTDVFGVGRVVAAYLIGHSGDIARFPGAGHYARYNGTAPIEASSGPTKRHRLNPRGNRQLNHALHIAAVTQVRKDTPGRAYYLPKQAQGKSKKDALRALKRRVSDAVYRELLADSQT